VTRWERFRWWLEERPALEFATQYVIACAVVVGVSFGLMLLGDLLRAAIKG
jgi:hypothetical protein